MKLTNEFPSKYCHFISVILQKKKSYRYLFPGKPVDRGPEGSAEQAQEAEQRPRPGEAEDLGGGAGSQGASKLHGHDGQRKGPEKQTPRPCEVNFNENRFS